VTFQPEWPSSRSVRLSSPSCTPAVPRTDVGGAPAAVRLACEHSFRPPRLSWLAYEAQPDWLWLALRFPFADLLPNGDRLLDSHLLSCPTISVLVKENIYLKQPSVNLEKWILKARSPPQGELQIPEMGTSLDGKFGGRYCHDRASKPRGA
jgi:hypothetical protein